jgi:hypothetical protein
MRRFKIAECIFEEDDAGLEEALADAYQRKVRPLCLCRQPGLPMYIARIGDQYVVKRMPLSGRDHDPACPSYEMEGDLSGLGAVLGSAIQLDPASGLAALKVGFSLSKVGSRSAPTVGAGNDDSVAGDTTRLSLRSVLHYLWHEAELTHWTLMPSL